MFIEKFVVKPRHIEIQVLATSMATASTWASANARSSAATRRSSRRRRRRFLDEKTRKAMGEQACALAKAVGYDQRRHGGVHRRRADKNFYFLEMNTRLQVEHPVTELITGIDLVEQMIRVCGGREAADCAG
jgi:propionyl-CoA carboxylase alpha chain